MMNTATITQSRTLNRSNCLSATGPTGSQVDCLPVEQARRSSNTAARIANLAKRRYWCPPPLIRLLNRVSGPTCGFKLSLTSNTRVCAFFHYPIGTLSQPY